MDANVTFESAKRAAMQGDKYKARSILREIIKVQPKNEDAWLLFADVTEKPEHAIQCLEKVLKLNPNNEAAHEKLAKYIRTNTENVSHLNTPISERLIRTILVIVGIVVIIIIFFISSFYKPNPEDAFSHAAGYALSEMYAQNPGNYGCSETENKKAAEWYEIKVSDLGNGKYYVIGATKAIDEFCIYNTGYFATTVYYDYENKNWMLDGKVYFSNPCITTSYTVTANDFGICTQWKYGWTPDMNWNPPNK